MHLYGFATEDERELFLQLISVAGVGPKMALAVLSGSSAAELRRAIAAGDSKRFQVVPGVGRKTAERVIVELREKIADELAVAPAGENGGGGWRARSRARAWSASATTSPRREAMLEPDRLGQRRGREPEELIAAALRRRR